MNQEFIRELLAGVQSGTISSERAMEKLVSGKGFVEIPDAVVDTDRERRCGIPEVIYCENKTPEQIVAVASVLYEKHGLAFGTRCSAEQYEVVSREFPDTFYDPVSRTVRVGSILPRRTIHITGVIAAGTSDLPVAEEAAVTLEAFGAPVERITDVGVAGVHRLLARREVIEKASVLIVVAGMEGALPSVVGGMTRAPLIAVPTSVGYGAALGGFTPLMGMLTSCASGISVVNIDNGFGAAAAALRILDMCTEPT